MTRTWIDDVVDTATNGDDVVRAVVVETRGSTPREVGAAMLVTAREAVGSIGGGALEYGVIAEAQALLKTRLASWQRIEMHYHLGPELNQCCGGAVTVLLERYCEDERASLSKLRLSRGFTAVTRPVATGVAPGFSHDPAPAGLFDHAGQRWFREQLAPAAPHVYIYGAGHVGRALVRALQPLPFMVTWLDISSERFPVATDDGVRRRIIETPAQAAAQAPADSFHLVMTYSHTLDEAIVAAILRDGRAAYLGLIGSATKAARFRQRLARTGISNEQLDRLVCPIGMPGLVGKEPSIIAASIAADLLIRRQQVDHKTAAF